MEGRVHGDRVALRRAGPDDLPRLLAILDEPAVARWWGSAAREELVRLVQAPTPEVTVVVVEHDGEVIGVMYASEEPDPDYRHAGIDVTLATDRHGQGLGTDAVRTLARWLVEVRGHHRVTIDPAADNAAAIACYRSVGFRPVGVLRRYERGPDGTWHDGLLLDLLADDLGWTPGAAPVADPTPGRP
jgi:aminoglycoside 6'-N-acetyltransferase